MTEQGVLEVVVRPLSIASLARDFSPSEIVFFERVA